MYKLTIKFLMLSLFTKVNYSAVSFIHRAGRTGRMGSGGKVTCIVKPEDYRLYQTLKPLVEQGADLQDSFSRKRSLGRKIKYEEDNQ